MALCFVGAPYCLTLRATSRRDRALGLAMFKVIQEIEKVLTVALTVFPQANNFLTLEPVPGRRIPQHFEAGGWQQTLPYLEQSRFCQCTDALISRYCPIGIFTSSRSHVRKPGHRFLTPFPSWSDSHGNSFFHQNWLPGYPVPHLR